MLYAHILLYTHIYKKITQTGYMTYRRHAKKGAAKDGSNGSESNRSESNRSESNRPAPPPALPPRRPSRAVVETEFYDLLSVSPNATAGEIKKV
jgi:hypothetical protein